MLYTVFLMVQLTAHLSELRMRVSLLTIYHLNHHHHLLQEITEPLCFYSATDMLCTRCNIHIKKQAY